MEERWYCVRSVTTDGSGHSIVETDVMPSDGLADTLISLFSLYNGRVSHSANTILPFQRWTFDQRLSDGRRVSDMLIVSRIP